MKSAEETLSGYKLTWEQVSIEVSRLHERGNQVIGEINIQAIKEKHPHLYRADFNFSSGNNREALIKQMNQRHEADWMGIIEQLCVYILEAYRIGSPMEELWTSEDINPPEYLLYPLMPLNEPTVLYADGGSGKSYVALILYICAILPWHDNPLGIEPRRKVNILYLDWEMDKRLTQWRLKCIIKGMGLPDLPLYYRRCYQPMCDDMEGIQQAVIKAKAECVIVDSIAAACGQVDLNKTEGAIGLYNSLRKLNVTSLLIGHTTKDPDAKTKRIYGSVFYNNYARSAWELKSVDDGDAKDIVLFHRKANISGFHKPIGFRMEFGANTMILSHAELKDIPELADHRPQGERILEFLAQGKFTAADIGEALGISEDVARVTLYRLQSHEKVVKLGKEWGLAFNRKL